MRSAAPVKVHVGAEACRSLLCASVGHVQAVEHEELLVVLDEVLGWSLGLEPPASPPYPGLYSKENQSGRRASLFGKSGCLNQCGRFSP